MAPLEFIWSAKVSDTYFSVSILTYAMLTYFSVESAYFSILKVRKSNAFPEFITPNKPSLVLIGIKYITLYSHSVPSPTPPSCYKCVI